MVQAPKMSRRSFLKGAGLVGATALTGIGFPNVILGSKGDDDHVVRLENSSRSIGITLPWSVAELEEMLNTHPKAKFAPKKSLH